MLFKVTKTKQLKHWKLSLIQMYLNYLESLLSGNFQVLATRTVSESKTRSQIWGLDLGEVTVSYITLCH